MLGIHTETWITALIRRSASHMLPLMGSDRVSHFCERSSCLYNKPPCLCMLMISLLIISFRKLPTFHPLQQRILRVLPSLPIWICILNVTYDLWNTAGGNGGVEQMSRFPRWASAESESGSCGAGTNKGSRRGCSEDNSRMRRRVKGLNVKNIPSGNKPI